MVRIRIMPKEEAQQTRRPKQPGIRKARMNQFDEYVRELRNNPGEAVVFEEIEENPQKFVLSLRGAFKRAGMDDVMVRKLRGRNEVRAWVSDKPIQRRSRPVPVAPAKRGGRGRRAS